MVYCISCNPKTRHLSILKQAYKTPPPTPAAVDTSRICWVLQHKFTAMHGNPLHSLQISVWCAVSENQILNNCLERQLLWKIIWIFWLNLLLFWKRRLLVFPKLGECLYCKNNNSCLAGLLHWSHCRASHLVTMIPRPYSTWVLTMGFLKVKVYSNIPKKSGGP